MDRFQKFGLAILAVLVIFIFCLYLISKKSPEPKVDNKEDRHPDETTSSGHSKPTSSLPTEKSDKTLSSELNKPISSLPTEKLNDNQDEKTYTVAEQMPEFPGGEEAMNEFLDKNLEYPQMAKKQGIHGKVWIGFMIDKFGNINKVEVLRGIGGGCDEEAARVVKLMPRWKPGMQSGRPVAVKFRFPINFKLR